MRRRDRIAGTITFPRISTRAGATTFSNPFSKGQQAALNSRDSPSSLSSFPFHPFPFLLSLYLYLRIIISLIVHSREDARGIRNHISTNGIMFLSDIEREQVEDASGMKRLTRSRDALAHTRLVLIPD